MYWGFGLQHIFWGVGGYNSTYNSIEIFNCSLLFSDDDSGLPSCAVVSPLPILSLPSQPYHLHSEQTMVFPCFQWCQGCVIVGPLSPRQNWFTPLLLLLSRALGCNTFLKLLLSASLLALWPLEKGFCLLGSILEWISSLPFCVWVTPSKGYSAGLAQAQWQKMSLRDLGHVHSTAGPLATSASQDPRTSGPTFGLSRVMSCQDSANPE